MGKSGCAKKPQKTQPQSSLPKNTEELRLSHSPSCGSAEVFMVAVQQKALREKGLMVK